MDFITFSKEELDTLFHSAKSGDSNSFNKLSQIVRQISYSYFYSKYQLGKIKYKEDAEDLTNNVYLTFAEQYQNIENLEYWLRRVLFLNFINWYKKNHSRILFELDEARYIESKDPYPGDNVDIERILDKLNLLNPDKQSILRMRFWEGLKFSEIAEQIQKTEDAVKKIFYRTIEELKDLL
ncbi:MAG: RNA polymerase sigma factor [Ignavibacteriaceae bacterium]